MRQSVARVLKKYGYTVCEAADGPQALALSRASRKPFACAIIDLVMPGMNGPELAAAFARIAPEMKVLFVSGYAPGEIAEHGRGGVGRAEVVTKPFHADELARKVRTILDRKE